MTAPLDTHVMTHEVPSARSSKSSWVVTGTTPDLEPFGTLGLLRSYEEAKRQARNGRTHQFRTSDELIQWLDE